MCRIVSISYDSVEVTSQRMAKRKIHSTPVEEDSDVVYSPSPSTIEYDSLSRKKRRFYEKHISTQSVSTSKPREKRRKKKKVKKLSSSSDSNPRTTLINNFGGNNENRSPNKQQINFQESSYLIASPEINREILRTPGKLIKSFVKGSINPKSRTTIIDNSDSDIENKSPNKRKENRQQSPYLFESPEVIREALRFPDELNESFIKEARLIENDYNDVEFISPKKLLPAFPKVDVEWDELSNTGSSLSKSSDWTFDLRGVTRSYKFLAPGRKKSPSPKYGKLRTFDFNAEYLWDKFKQDNPDVATQLVQNVKKSLPKQNKYFFSSGTSRKKKNSEIKITGIKKKKDIRKTNNTKKNQQMVMSGHLCSASGKWKVYQTYNTTSNVSVSSQNRVGCDACQNKIISNSPDTVLSHCRSFRKYLNTFETSDEENGDNREIIDPYEYNSDSPEVLQYRSNLKRKDNPKVSEKSSNSVTDVEGITVMIDASSQEYAKSIEYNEPLDIGTQIEKKQKPNIISDVILSPKSKFLIFISK